MTNNRKIVSDEVAKQAAGVTMGVHSKLTGDVIAMFTRLHGVAFSSLKAVTVRHYAPEYVAKIVAEKKDRYVAASAILFSMMN